VPLYVLMVVRGLKVTVRRSERGDVVVGLAAGRWYWGNNGEVSVVAIAAGSDHRVDREGIYDRTQCH
jgi:hypothetical protein